MPAAVTLVLVATLSACSGSSGSPSGTSAATATSTPGSSAPTGSAAPSCDAAGLPAGLGCQTFASVSGTSSSADVAWLSGGTLTVSLEAHDGVAVLGVGTPCNALTVPVTVGGSQLVPDKDKIGTTLMACGAEATAQEHWAAQFVSQPMTYALDGSRLTLTTTDEQVVLEHR